MEEFFDFLKERIAGARKYTAAGRDYALYRTLYLAGLRAEESASMDRADVHFGRGPFGKLHVRFGKGALTSGPRPRWVPLLDGLDLILRWYLGEIRPRLGEGPALFCDEGGGPSHPGTVRTRRACLLAPEPAARGTANGGERGWKRRGGGARGGSAPPGFGGGWTPPGWHPPSGRPPPGQNRRPPGAVPCRRCDRIPDLPRLPGTVKFGDRARCHICHRRVTRAALKRRCPNCDQLRHLGESGVCAICERGTVPGRPAKTIACARCGEQRRNARQGLCNPCSLADPDRPSRYSAATAGRRHPVPAWWDNLTAFAAARHHPGGAIVLLPQAGPPPGADPD